MLRVGQLYVRKLHAVPHFRRIDKIVGNQVHYTRVEQTPNQARRRPPQAVCTACSFHRWMTGTVEDESDLSRYYGHRKYTYYELLDYAGNPLVQASEPTVNRYLRKGYLKLREDGQYQFTSTVFQERLLSIHGSLDNPIFRTIKNHHCYICGRTSHLAKHHVVPKRIHPQLPATVHGISGAGWTICACESCHKACDLALEGFIAVSDPITQPAAWLEEWEAKFRSSMNPKFLPPGWRLVYTPQTKSTP